MNIINLLNFSFGNSLFNKLNHKDIFALRLTSNNVNKLVNIQLKEDIKKTLNLNFDFETNGNPFIDMWKDMILINEGIVHDCGHISLDHPDQKRECIVCCEKLTNCDECIKNCKGCGINFCNQCSNRNSWNCGNCNSEYCYVQCDFRNLKQCDLCSTICCQKCIIYDEDYDQVICKGHKRK